MVWFVQPCVGVIGLKMANEMAKIIFQKLANEAERKYEIKTLASFLLLWQVQIFKTLPNWQETRQKSVVKNDLIRYPSKLHRSIRSGPTAE